MSIKKSKPSKDFSLRLLLRKILKAVPHVVCASFILMLPVGYNADSLEYSLGVYGGTGQVATVFRGCNSVTPVGQNDFNEIAGTVSATVPISKKSKFVYGLKGGRINIGQFKPYSSDVIIRNNKYSSNYINPHISYEHKYFGLGFGYISGYISMSFYDSTPNGVRFSGHLRIGNYNRLHYVMSLAENVPLISGGGLFDMGFGYKIGKSIRMFSGVSGGFYESAGYLQQIRYSVNKKMSLDLTFRIGSAEGISENAISGGIIYNFKVIK